MSESELLHNRFWRGFTPDHDPQDAVRIFESRYGRRPDYVIKTVNLLAVGPVPEDEPDAGLAAAQEQFDRLYANQFVPQAALFPGGTEGWDAQG